jgi:hypothetical protein
MMEIKSLTIYKNMILSNQVISLWYVHDPGHEFCGLTRFIKMTKKWFFFLNFVLNSL